MARGPSCLIEAATRPDVDVVLNAVVGFAGLDATVAALRAGKRVALANKESLVVGGALVLEAARQGGGELVPVDSEHSAVLQCLAGGHGPAARLTLTASGGPFREWPAGRIHGATVAEALQHPTWRMGSKITVDSATLVNKALEVIEAHFLFGLDYSRIRVVVHPQSIVHALVEFEDGSTVAQLGMPSMELPILYALTYPDRADDVALPRYDPVAAGPLTFEPVRGEAFPAFAVGVEAGRRGGTAPAVFNAVNEEAVAAFLRGAVPFGRIAEVLERVCAAHQPAAVSTLEAVREADRWARHHAREMLG
ncbi:MAG: 1-deoxy-D-xylulose 5-phosphate reductoisomerase [Gemmatimonadetes bacterium]|nr:1-deoxy-D-xylulose 5-phosphate reductoisomerase [Gemmatimonadota bacterium]